MRGVERKERTFREYTRSCKRCTKLYKANSRCSTICEDCNLRIGSKIWKKKKEKKNAESS